MAVLEGIPERAGWVLAATLGLTLLALAVLVDPRTGEIRLEVDPAADRLLPEDDADRRFYDRVRHLFGSDDQLVVALVADDVFTAETLARIASLTERIRAVDGVREVLSVANALNVRGIEGGLEIAPFFLTPPGSPEAMEELRREVLGNPIYGGSLVSRDGRAAAVLVSFVDMSNREFRARGLDERIAAIAEEERGGDQVWITGGPHIAGETARVLLSETVRLPLLIGLALAAVLLLSFRTARGVWVPLATIALAVAWTLALVVATGHSLNAVTVLIPPLLTTLGLSYSVHVVSEYYDATRESQGEGPAQRVAAALAKVALPVGLTGLTTAVGFASLALSPLPAVREFGLLSVIGVGCTVAASLTFTPAVLALLPPSRRLPPGAGASFERLVARVAHFDLTRRPLIFGVFGALFALALLGAAGIRIGTEQISKFRPDAPVRVHFEAVNQHLEGANPFFVVLQSDARDAFMEPANLKEIEALQGWLEAQPEIGGTTSLADYVKLLNRGFHENRPDQLVIPERRQLVSQLLLFGASPELRRFVEVGYHTTTIQVRARVVDSDEVEVLTRRIEERLTALPERLQGRVTGTAVVFNRALDGIIRGQALSVVAALGTIYAILALLFLSVRIGLIALVPNVIPVAAYFGALGWSGISLNPGTSLIAPMVLGIAVDDTIHYFARFLRDAKRLGDEERATAAALSSVGRPVTYTTAALCVGFLCLTVAEFRTQAELGVLAAFALAFAWATDVVLTPALCSRVRIVTLWDLLSLDLGPEPHRSIEIFDGLSAAQARIVALMGRLIDAPAGRSVFHAGEPGSGLYVMISGGVRTWVTRQEGEVTLGLYQRGECVGEAGFFQGEYAVHCDVDEDARMLRLSGECLEQLGRRYPRVAATLHGNLNKILAARLALRTRESALDDAFFRVPAIFRPPADGSPGLALDPSLSETLAGLGIRTETLAALTLIPLVKVAWADQHLDAEERRAVLRGAESVGIAQDGPDHALLRAWLEKRPDPRIFEAWRDFVAALCARLSIEGQLELRDDLLGRAREVAAAAGGFLGVRSISRREEAVLRELESVFGV
jgi:predicted RND superfamily exporter protein/CRP-like cAMP-binding protein